MTERAILYTACRNLSGSLLCLITYLDFPQATHMDYLSVRGKGENCHE